VNRATNNQQGYVLVSVMAILLTVLAAVIATNASFRSKISIDKKTSVAVRSEIQKSAFAHLNAYAEASNCEANSSSFSVEGSKDGIEYNLSWEKTATGNTLTGQYQLTGDNASTWTNTDYGVELFGKKQSTSWILASYFSSFVEIKLGKKDHHKEHGDKEYGKAELDQEMVLRSLKLGPLRTEPLKIVQAELQLTGRDDDVPNDPSLLFLNAIKYPWDPEDVTDSYDGLGDKTDWPETGLDKFETIDTVAKIEDGKVNIDMTGLINSWLSNARPNYGFAITSGDSTKFEWHSEPGNDNYEDLPRINLDYRCSCAEACVGVKQNEALALGTYFSIDSDGESYGGGNDKMAKLWLHRANVEYLELDPANPHSGLDRPSYYPMGLSEFEVMGISDSPDKDIIGAHIELANDEHPDYHYYTLMAGDSVTKMPKVSDLQALLGAKTDISNVDTAELVYLRSDANKPVGDSLEERMLPAPMDSTKIDVQAVNAYITDSDTYVGGFTYYDDRYWFGQYVDSNFRFQDIPVRRKASSTQLHEENAGVPRIDSAYITMNDQRVPDALHVIDQYNFLLSAEYIKSYSPYDTRLGQLRFHDGDIVLYNTVSKRARLIDGEASRSNGNNVWSIALFEEPSPRDYPDDDASKDIKDEEFKKSYPFMFE